MDLESQIKEMMHSPIHNYIVPGLTSWKIGEDSDHGMVRLFTCSRDHQENIIPHTHRFNFQCQVIKGYVNNKVWIEDNDGDDFMVCDQIYSDIGNYIYQQKEIKRYSFVNKRYYEGQNYGLKHDVFHSIEFSKDSMVLFLQGKNLTNTSQVLMPYVNNEVVELDLVQEWMFQKE